MRGGGYCFGESRRKKNAYQTKLPQLKVLQRTTPIGQEALHCLGGGSGSILTAISLQPSLGLVFRALGRAWAVRRLGYGWLYGRNPRNYIFDKGGFFTPFYSGRL